MFLAVQDKVRALRKPRARQSYRVVRGRRFPFVDKERSNNMEGMELTERGMHRSALVDGWL